ncbi:MAG TPA: protein-export chaperone SecB [Candidatus Cybelea sp.]|nr:protein-export chaperone SecB [Candidatus Cybelea sp.]
MSENGKNPDQSAAPAGPPGLSVNAQYVKDLSFENPNAPQVLTQTQGRPQIEVAVDVRARNLAQSAYEVAVRIAATAKQAETTVFVVELLYAGVFTLQNIPQDQVELVLLIECPRILFPFARRIVADATRDGGFPPLMLEPIDFMQLYQQQRQQGQTPVAQA